MANFTHNEMSDVWGEPQKYKKLEIYPVKVKNILEFFYSVECLMLRKNRETDLRFFRMTYFEYLMRKIIDSNDDKKKKGYNELLFQFLKLLRLVFRDESIGVEKNIKPNGDNLILVINDEKIHGNNFDEIRQIIFTQNCVTFDDDLSIDMENAMNAKRKIEEVAGNKQATFPEQIIKYHEITHKKYEEIKDMTIYQFIKGIREQQIIKDFEVYTYPAIKAGKHIKHWLTSAKEENPYSSLFMTNNQINTIAKSGKVKESENAEIENTE